MERTEHKNMKTLSILLYFDTTEEKTVRKCFDSIFRTSGLSEDELQVILLDLEEQAGISCLSDLKKEHPDSVLSVSVSGVEMARAYNQGLKLAEGEYVSFMRTSSFYGANAWKDLFHASDLGEKTKASSNAEKNLLSLCPVFYDGKKTEQIYPVVPSGDGVIDLHHMTAGAKGVQLVLPAYAVRRAWMGDLRLREELHEEALTAMLLELLVKNEGRFFYDSKAQYVYTVPLENDPEGCGLAEKKWWYLDSVRNFLLDLVRKMEGKYPEGLPGYLQQVIFYLICVKLRCNLQGKDKQMMTPQEVKIFWNVCQEIFAAMDDDLLYQCGETQFVLPRALRVAFLRMKAEQLGCRMQVDVRDGMAVCSRLDARNGEKAASEEMVLADLSKEALDIRVINYRAGKLEIDGFFEGTDFLCEDSFELYGEISGKSVKRVEMKSVQVYGLLKCFGVTYAKKYGVHIEVPVEELAGQGRKLTFYLECGDSLNRLNLTFSGMNSRLLTYSQKAYWRFDHDRYVLTRTGKCLQISESTAIGTLRHELLFDAAMLAQKNRRGEAVTCVLVRLLYWMIRPFMKKRRIWITFDKLFKGGDNGEYMFRYCRDRQEEIDCYYVINKDAPDRKELEKRYPGRILYANTWKERLVVLHAEVILATHAGASTYLGFPGRLHKYFKDLYQSDNVCIQHGLSIQKIAHFQNRLYANTKLYCCASPFEIQNISHPVYGYEPEMLKLTGLARYDGLKNREQKQILITPTWRKNAVHTKGVGMTNSHNDHFKEMPYFRIYNTLINDPKLIACARETGYRIVFLLHPAMSAQMEDYDRNDFVQIIPATGNMSYEKILTESSLMVTDYSGVQFDFAYQRKPLLYYHSAELPPHYTEGGLIYDTMGFGPICTTHEQIVGALCEYMKDGCQMKDEYKQRADQFFAYDDFHNAERICQAVLEFEREYRS